VDLITEDTKIMEEYFLEKFPGTLMYEEDYHLLLLVIGEKEGVLIMSADKEQRKVIEEFCRELGLEMKVVEGEKRSLLDKILGRSSPMNRDSIYITRNSERFTILEDSKGMFTGFSSRAVGEFLGYPEKAINFYEENDVPGMEFEEGLKELTDKDIFSESELELLDLLDYVTSPEKESIQEALEVAKSREKALQRLDSELDTTIGEKYLREIKA